jgi:hypothetical protein
MRWLDGRTATSSEELASMPFAADFASAVDHAFPTDDAAVQRIRGRVLGAFIQEAPAPAVPRLSRPITRGLTVALAAIVGLFAFGSVGVEAQPGGPFYPLRLAIETAGLPSIDAPAGWDARLGRLGRRIDESLAASRSGNPGAVAATLVEYRSELAGLTGGLVDAGRRSRLMAVVSGDLATVAGLAGTYPSDAAKLLVADMQAVIGSTDPNDGNAGPHRPTNPAADGASGDPHSDGATGNPHSDGSTGNPHSDGSTGNPHTPGSKGNPHKSGGTGNPHAGGRSNPHAPGSKGNPHSGSGTGNPHAGG